MDSDSHTIIDAVGKINSGTPIIIDEHVWIGAKSTVLKGTYIAKDVVVAAGSIVNGAYGRTSSIIGGNPAKVLKSDIAWNINCPD